MLGEHRPRRISGSRRTAQSGTRPVVWPSQSGRGLSQKRTVIARPSRRQTRRLGNPRASYVRQAPDSKTAVARRARATRFSTYGRGRRGCRTTPRKRRWTSPAAFLCGLGQACSGAGGGRRAGRHRSTGSGTISAGFIRRRSAAVPPSRRAKRHSRGPKFPIASVPTHERPGQAIAPVAQRVVLYEEDPNDPAGQAICRLGDLAHRDGFARARAGAGSGGARRRRDAGPPHHHDVVDPAQHRSQICRPVTPSRSLSACRRTSPAAASTTCRAF